MQLAMPAGGEGKARAFYAGILGMEEVPKPAALAKRGGVWFRSGAVRIDLGIEDDFQPARKAHPGLRCSDYDGLLEILRKNAVEIRADFAIPETTRAYVHDPFGNRIELIKFL